MAERAPYNCLLAETFHKTDVMVGESTEFFYHVFLRVRVFVCTDMYTLAYEYRIVALTKTAYYTELNRYTEETTVKVMNPLSSDLGVMRQTLLFGGLESVALYIPLGTKMESRMP